MKNLFKPLLSFLGLFVACIAFSQDYRDCDKAFAVCDSRSVSFDVSDSGANDIISVTAACPLRQNATIWLRIKISTPGELNFVIQPIDKSEDYDFGVFGPNPNCDGLGSAIRSSFSGQTGDTGLRSTSTENCENESGDKFVAALNVSAGDEYVILIDNYSAQFGPVSGFTMEWGGDAGLDCSIVSGNLGPDQDLCVGDMVRLDGTTATATSYEWFLDPTPDNGTDDFAPIAGETNPVLTINNNVTGIYRVTVSDGVTEDSDDVILRFSEVPTATAPLNWFECDTNNDGSFSFNLSSLEPTILNGQDPGTFSVSFHNSQINADDNLGALSANYTNNAQQETVFVRVENNNNTNCYATTQFDIAIFDTPTAVDAAIPLANCSTSTSAIFDLTMVEDEVRDNVATMNVTYFPTRTDAENETSEITTPNNYTATSGAAFAVVKDPNNNNCSAIAEISLLVLNQPQRIDPPPIELCSSNGMADFDITSVTDLIINNVSNVNVSYHETFDNANAPVSGGIDPITNLTNYNASSTIAYARSQANYQGGFCATVSEVILQANDNPVANYVLLKSCDNQNTSSFDLNTIEDAITGGTTNRLVTFFPSQATADTNLSSNELPKNFTSPTSTIFARVENTNTNCMSTTPIDIEVVRNPVITENVRIVSCYRNGVATFNLGAEKARLEGEYIDFVFTFYGEELDAEMAMNELMTNHVAEPGTIYTRIQLRGEDCFTVKPVELAVSEVPIIEQEDIICLGDGYLLPDGKLVVETGLYDVTIIDPNSNCDIRYIIDLTVGEIEFASAITPNGNGENDFFGALPSAACAGFVDEYNLKVWNRWGEKVFETTDYGTGWDGQFNGYNAQAGIYLYRVVYVFQGERTERDGIVHLLQ